MQRERGDFPYLSPRIFVENQNDFLTHFTDLREQLNEYIGRIPEPTGVYFEYLPTGATVGVNDRENFIAASLLKVPLVLGAYKLIEEGRLEENRPILIEEEHLDRHYGTLWKQGGGREVPLQDILRSILTYSDNTAANALYDSLVQVDVQIIERVFEDLDIPFEFESERIAVVSPKNYSSILRSLYLASSLSKEHSHHILDLMTQSEFNQQIVAGIPKGITVSHKTGTYELDGYTLHSDCGIVFVPQRPYILCIMSKALEARAHAHMRDISRIVYEYVSTVTP